MSKAAAGLLLAAVAAPPDAAMREEPAARLEVVPYVRCPDDGQMGPQEAPRSAPTPRLPAAEAERLAFYRSAHVGVLAPRGWHCVGLYGSDGSGVIVTPEQYRPSDFFPGEIRFHGPAVQLSYSYGGTSGRFSVVSAIGRYFPDHMAFARRVIADELGPDPMPTAPYPADRIERRSNTEIRFTTPAGREGEGTNWLFDPAGGAVDGLVLLLPPDEEPDLLSVRVRLPAGDAALVDSVIDEAARRFRDGAAE